MTQKILYIIFEGLIESSPEKLSEKTPLSAAFSPNLDRLAQKGKTGVILPTSYDYTSSLISLFGYDAQKYYNKIAAIESLAEGLEFSDGDLALRAKFVTVAGDGKTIIDTVEGSLTSKEAGILAKEINSKVVLSSATFDFKNTFHNEGVLVIHGQRMHLSEDVSNASPAYSREGLSSFPSDKFQNMIIKAQPLTGYENDPKVKEAAKLLNEFTEKSRQVLQNSEINRKRAEGGGAPANAIILRDAGDCLQKFPSLKGIYGLKFGLLTCDSRMRTIASLTGVEIVDLQTSDDYSQIAKSVLDNIKVFDGLFLYVRVMDEFQDKVNIQKKEAIEKIDKSFLNSILSSIDLKNTIMAMMMADFDYCGKRPNVPSFNPLVICGGGIKSDGTLSFSEKTAKLGSLGCIKGEDVLPLLIKLAKD